MLHMYKVFKQNNVAVKKNQSSLKHDASFVNQKLVNRLTDNSYYVEHMHVLVYMQQQKYKNVHDVHVHLYIT